LSHLICLDANILFKYPFEDKKIESYREEYEKVRGTQGPLTKWQYIFFTDNNLTISPLVLWEYLSSKIRNKESFEKARRDMDTVRGRFGISLNTDPFTFDIAVLFGAVTGVPCIDAYNFVYAIGTSAEFFATDNKKHFRILREIGKTQIISRMSDILNRYKPPSDFLVPLKTKPAIHEVSSLDWPQLILDPVDIPYS